MNKELSIEEKAKAYDKAIERAKQHCADYVVETIFKLKESENKKPNGAIVMEDFNEGNGFYKVNLAYLNKEQIEEIEGLVKKWNPKSKESDGEMIRKAIIEHFAGSHSSMYPYKGFTKEQIITWLEKQGEPTEINPSEFDSQLNRLLKQFEFLPKEDLASSLSFYLNVVQNDGTYKEEKQGEQQDVSIQINPSEYINDMGGNGCYLKNTTQKPAEEIEPTPIFRIGDILKRKGKDYTFRVDRIQCGYYYSDSNRGAFFPIEEQGNWELVEQKSANKVEPKFKVKYADNEYNVLEVRDIAGVTYYGIEDEPNHIDYVKAENCEIISGYAIKENGSPYPTNPAVFSEQNPAWSEEDDEHLERILKELENQHQRPLNSPYLDKIESDYNWLKSIKERYTWKPSDEQIKLLREVQQALLGKDCHNRFVNFMYELKRLREE